MKTSKVLTVSLLALTITPCVYAHTSAAPGDQNTTTTAYSTNMENNITSARSAADPSTTNGLAYHSRTTTHGTVTSDPSTTNGVAYHGTMDTPAADTVITAKVKSTFVREGLFGNSAAAPMNIDVQTKDGVVTLTGTVDNAAQAAHAVNLARSVGGVKNVTSTIAVKNGGTQL
jgi:hyperosmotically inducible protein